MKSHEENTWQVARTWQSARAGNAAELRAALRCQLIRWGSDFLWGLDHGYCTKEHTVYIYINTMIWYDMIQYDMIWYDTSWYDMIWYNMIWYDMIQYDMIWYDMIQYDMIWYYCLYIHIIQVCLFENALYIIYIYVRAGQTVCRLILYAESQMRHFYPIVTTHN